MEAKLSMWSSYYIDLNPYDMVLELERIGCEYSELSDEHGLTLLNESEDIVATGKKFKEFADKHNVHFLQGHLWLDIKLCAKDNTIEKLKQWIVLFESIGITRMVLHCDDMSGGNLSYQDVLNENIQTLMKIKPFLENRNVIICLENLVAVTKNVDELLYIVNKLDSPNFGICLDTGHLNLTCKNQREFILKANDKLKALHIADNEGYNDQHLMPFGRGNVNFNEVIESLKEINYEGLLNYEIPGERDCSLEIRKLKFEYIKKTFNLLINND